MSKQRKRQAQAHPCSTCPWITANHGKRHRDAWYTVANLRRLWAGIRTGEQMICHTTDPESLLYGGEKSVKPGHERLCIGQLILVMRSIHHLERMNGFTAYRAGVGIRMSKAGIERWAWSILTGGAFQPLTIPEVAVDTGVGVPWPDPVLNGAAPGA